MIMKTHIQWRIWVRIKKNLNFYFSPTIPYIRHPSHAVCTGGKRHPLATTIGGGFGGFASGSGRWR